MIFQPFLDADEWFRLHVLPLKAYYAARQAELREDYPDLFDQFVVISNDEAARKYANRQEDYTTRLFRLNQDYAAQLHNLQCAAAQRARSIERNLLDQQRQGGM